jgi:phthalate 4,5-dioxygenase
MTEQSMKPFDLLTRVENGAPMGDVLRHFWLPALLSSELAERDGAPLRLRILGEDLVAFRDTKGRVGILEAYCPHKLAPLFFGRNEECGLRCVYHGWKFDVTGECVDMPNIIPPDNFDQIKKRLSVTGYETREAAGIVWVYMGPKGEAPELPQMEWMTLPPGHVHVSRWLHRSNWVQGLEGEIDTSHISFLHSSAESKIVPDLIRLAKDGAPKITIRDTDYGFVYGARRHEDDASFYWRVTHWLLPMWSAIPPRSITTPIFTGRGWVPIDDYLTTAFAYRYRLDRPFTPQEIADIERGDAFPPRMQRGPFQLPHGYVIDTFLPAANKENDYLIDREFQKKGNFTGIWGVNEQDRALQEYAVSADGGRPGIVDRAREHLVASDAPTATARSRLIQLARAIMKGEKPLAAARPQSYAVRAISRVSPHAELDALLGEHGHEMMVPPHAGVPAE